MIKISIARSEKYAIVNLRHIISVTEANDCRQIIMDNGEVFEVLETLDEIMKGVNNAR